MGKGSLYKPDDHSPGAWNGGPGFGRLLGQFGVGIGILGVLFVLGFRAKLNGPAPIKVEQTVETMELGKCERIESPLLKSGATQKFCIIQDVWIPYDIWAEADSALEEARKACRELGPAHCRYEWSDGFQRFVRNCSAEYERRREECRRLQPEEVLEESCVYDWNKLAQRFDKRCS